MAIAHDVVTTATFTTTATFNHAGNANARAAVVLIHQSGSTDEITTVTYGGAAMAELGTNSETTEAGRVYIYFLDNIAGGTQEVIITSTGSTAKRYVVSTMTVGSGMMAAVAGAGYATGTSASVANPTWNITGLTASVPVLAYEVIHSGLQSMTTTPQASPAWTLINSNDLGSIGNGFARIANTPAGTTLACGWAAATADDFVGASVAFQEATAPTAVGDTVQLIWKTATLAGDTAQVVSNTEAPVGDTSQTVWNVLAPQSLIHKWLASDIAQSDGTKVASWTDSVGGKVISQATDANRPTYKTNVLNGQPAVLFDRTASQRLFNATYAAFLNSLTGFTIFIVFKTDGGPSGGNYWGNMFVSFAQADGKARVSMALDASARYEAYQQETGVTHTYVPSSPTVGANQAHVAAFATDTAAQWYVDGTATTDGTTAWTLPGSGNANIYSMGSWGVVGDWFGGHIAEVRIYNYKMDATQVATVNSELSTTYGLGGTTAVSKDSQVVYKVATPIGDTSQIVAKVATSAGDTSQIVAKVAALAGDTSQVIAKVRGLASDASQIVYKVVGLAGDTSQVIYNVASLSSVGKSSQVVFKVTTPTGDTSQIVAKVRTTTGDTSQVIAKVRGLASDTSQIVAKVAALAGDTSQVIAKVAALAGDTSQIVFKVVGLAGDTSQIIYKVATNTVVHNEPFSGTDGTDITTSNTTLDEVSGSGTIQFATNPSNRNGTGAKLIGTSRGYIAGDLTPPITSGKLFARTYVYFTDADTTYQRVFSAEDHQAGYLGNGWNTWASGTDLRLVSLSANSGTDYTVSLNTWYRLELDIDYTNKTVEGRIYLGDSVTPLTTQNTSWTTIARTNVNGQCDVLTIRRTAAGSTYFDDFAWQVGGTSNPGPTAEMTSSSSVGASVQVVWNVAGLASVYDAIALRWNTRQITNGTGGPTRYFGVNTHPIWGSSTGHAVEAAYWDTASIPTVRSDCGWYLIEETEGVKTGTYLSQMDDYLAKAAAHGVKVTLIITGAPTWAADAAGGNGTPPNTAHYSSYASFCAWATSRWGPHGSVSQSVEAIEVWNEPNFGGSWTGNGDGGCLGDWSGTPHPRTPNLYSDLLAAAYSAIKAADSAMLVVGAGGLLSQWEDWRCSTHFTNLTTYGSWAHMDVISCHNYPDHITQIYPALTSPNQPWYNPSNKNASIIGMIETDILSVMVSAGYGSMPIWVTETGYSTVGSGGNSCTEAQQATKVGELLDDFAAQPWPTNFERIYWYSLFDGTAAQDADPEYNWGLINLTNNDYNNLSGLSTKPSWSTFVPGTKVISGSAISEIDLRYTTRSLAGDQGQIIYKVNSLVTDNIQVVFNVLGSITSIGDTSQIIWKVVGKAADTSQVIWKVRILVGDQEQLVSKVSTTLGDTGQIIWKTRTLAGDQEQLVYRVASTLSDQGQLIYKVRGIANDSSQVIFKVRTLAGDSSQFIYGVRAYIGDQEVLRHAVRLSVLDNSQIMWKVRAPAGDESTVVFRTLGMGIPISMYDVWGINF